MIETRRLTLRRLVPEDAPFILELLNDADFLRYIGDKGARTVEDAVKYIRGGPLASYERLGFGLYCVTLREGGEPIGICGLLKRDTLEDVDVGFALLPRYRAQGYALESTAAVLEHGRDTFGLLRVLAITSPDNAASIGVLERLGFRFESLRRLAGSEPEVRVFARETLRSAEEEA